MALRSYAKDTGGLMDYHSRNAYVVYPCKCFRDEYLAKWQNYTFNLIEGDLEYEHHTEVLVHSIHWCMYFAGRRERMP